MSNAAKKTIRHSLVAAAPGSDLLERWGFSTTPDASLVNREETIDSNNRRKVKLNGVVQEYAFMSDLTSYWRNRGAWDASAGIPTAAGSTILTGQAIKANDTWRVTTGGTITGILGADVLEPGDTIVAISDGASTAADFMVIEINQVKAPSPFEDIALAALPADTATAVNASTVTAIKSVDVWDATGNRLTDALVVQRTAANQITLTSSVALSNLTISVGGTV